MRKSDPQRVENFVRSARKQLENPDLPDDLRAMYQRIADRGELREILVSAQEKSRVPSKPTKGTSTS